MGGGGNLNLGGRVNYPPYHPQDSALANSLLSQQQQQQVNGHGHGHRLYPYPEDVPIMHSQPQPPMQPQPPYDNIPVIDTGLVSDAGSKYGSPPEDGRHAMSPIGRSALDAPLPASFDSQGISYIARHGPVASSVPSRFGLDLSPTPSNRPEMFRNLHEHAFGADLKKYSALSSSPILSGDEGTTARIMHSQRVSRPKMLSASLPRPTVLDDWDDNFAMEEDYLPTNLHDDVLTPQEKMRRLSRTEHDSHTGSLGGFGLPLTGSTKVGSPLASSPSRFGALFAKQRQKKEEEGQGAFGHVGSPLRDSTLSMRSSPGIRPIGSRPGSGDISPFVTSPGRQPSSMSMITQQLSTTSLHPNSARHAPPGSRLDRTISSPVSTSRIDEEQGDLVFSMEEEEGKRNSSTWNANKNITTGGSTASREPETPTATTPKDIVYKKR